MRLTRLEIKGFKSFGDKTLIHFDEGITAIVGPNGCGKSNVVDAIRWVLGEQSTRTLRSEKMENIIFNGSKNRKPSNLAEVSLTFDNTKNILPTEYSTVTITRKLYRSGESEYRLNDIQCRLKDITDLFLDTGIGTNSYSIIELKMIEEILSNRENSRRNLFEEAAGISKYKIRKKQTLHKLKETETDLSRVDDLLFEIEKNLKTLEAQAKKTERYYKLKENYKELSTQLAAFKLQSFNSTLTSLEQQEKEHEDVKLGINTKADALEALLQKEKLEVLTKEKNLAIQQKATNDFVASIREYESNKKLKNEQLRFAQEKAARLSQELEIDKNSAITITENLQTLEQQKLDEEAVLSLSEKNLHALKEALDSLQTAYTTTKNEVDVLSHQNRSVQETIYKTEKELDINRIQKDSLVQEQQRNQSDANLKKEELNEFNKAISTFESTLKEKESEQDKLVLFEDYLAEQQARNEEELQENKDTLATQHRLLDAKQNEYNLTKSLVDNLEGFPESIKFLRKNAAWTKNAPLLSDVLFCKEEYRITIENFLEPYMNHYVVQNGSEAIQAINLLSDAAKGRAHFFVLDAFDQTTKADTSLFNIQDSKYIAAIDIVECEEKYRKLCSYLLQNVYIVISDEEQSIANHYDSSVVLLSKSGKYARTTFSMAGGSVGLFEGKRIGRAKNLELLGKEIKTSEEKIVQLKTKIDTLQNALVKLKDSSKAPQLAALKEEINRLKNDYAALKARQEQYQTFINSSTTRAEDIEQKITYYTEQLTQLSPTLVQLQVDKQIAADQLESKQKSLQELSELLSAQSGQYNQQNIAFHQQQNKVAAILKDVEYKQAHQKSITQRIDNNTAELVKTNADIQEIVAHTDTNDEDLLAMYEQKQDMEKALQEAEENYFKLRGSITELENTLSDIRRNRDQSDMLVTAIKDKKTTLIIELNSLKERLSVEFNVHLEDLLETAPPENETEASIKDKNDKVKQSLDTFGAINPMAVEAYKEIEERYTFIITQKNDLLSAKASLNDTISEIDETAKTQFMDAFVLVRENFVKVFRSLFNEEDSCDIYLTNPEDPLESDIDIIAKPKGKRPLTINQLSGGEKTLTATAILFSLYLLKPAPFCIFDEVDAPLDDTNIDKFNSIIRKFSDESQFIVVTHNKRTIASTDIIYGVTMVEQGVSRVVPVDLRAVPNAA